MSLVADEISHYRLTPVVLIHLQDSKDSIQSVAQLTQQLLISKAEMLRECVGISIDSEGCLVGLPVLIDHYTPDLERLPQFVLQLARHVDWQTEKACFQGLAKVGSLPWHPL